MERPENTLDKDSVPQTNSIPHNDHIPNPSHLERFEPADKCKCTNYLPQYISVNIVSPVLLMKEGRALPSNSAISPVVRIHLKDEVGLLKGYACSTAQNATWDRDQSRPLLASTGPSSSLLKVGHP